MNDYDATVLSYSASSTICAKEIFGRVEAGPLTGRSRPLVNTRYQERRSRS
jgi:hypothetical protein